MTNPAAVSCAKYRFSAFQVAPAGELYEQEFLKVVSSIESHSSHALAKCVIYVAKKNNVPILPVIGFNEFPERGVGGAVEVSDGVYRAAVLGTREFLSECGFAVPAILETAVRKWETDSKVVFGGWDGWVRGILKFNKE